MLSSSAKGYGHSQVGAHHLDAAVSSKLMGMLAALVGAIGLLFAFILLANLIGGAVASRDAAAPASVQLSAPRISARPVAALERTDLSVTVSNPSARALEDVSLELKVLQPDGSEAMVARQSHITLQPHDSRAIYWQWRVPAQLASGVYGVEVRAFDATGRPLGSGQPAQANLQIAGR